MVLESVDKNLFSVGFLFFASLFSQLCLDSLFIGYESLIMIGFIGLGFWSDIIESFGNV